MPDDTRLPAGAIITPRPSAPVFDLPRAPFAFTWRYVREFPIPVFFAMLCFGGGLGTLPPFASDLFGLKHVGPIMGLLMTAQGAIRTSGVLAGRVWLARTAPVAGSVTVTLTL